MSNCLFITILFFTVNLMMYFCFKRLTSIAILNKYNHLIVIRLSALGDVAMTVPVLRALTKQNPNLRITYVSKPFLKPLFEDLPGVEFFAAEVKSEHKGLPGLFRLFLTLKKRKPDAVVDLHNVLRSKLLRVFFSCTFKKVVVLDKGRTEKKALTRQNNKVFKPLKTTHERYADTFRQLGFSVDLTNPEFPKKKALGDKILQLVQNKAGSWIGIAPFAQYNSKMYPLEMMETVIETLSKQHHLKIFLFGGGKKEVDLLEKLSTKYSNCKTIAGQLKFEEELALISYLDLMLSMDSGNAHFAAMLGIPTITVWGVTHPFAGFSPFHQPKDYSILPDLKKYPNLPCSIYGNKVFEGYENVMRSISPESIVEKINAVLSLKNRS